MGYYADEIAFWSPLEPRLFALCIELRKVGVRPPGLREAARGTFGRAPPLELCEAIVAGARRLRVKPAPFRAPITETPERIPKPKARGWRQGAGRPPPHART